MQSFDYHRVLVLNWSSEWLKQLGLPPVPPITVDKIKRLREEGMSLRKIAKQVGISTSKVHQLV